MFIDLKMERRYGKWSLKAARNKKQEPDIKVNHEKLMLGSLSPQNYQI
jgi:hypothetical protein